jgi:beta-glucanase (GH16 family)
MTRAAARSRRADEGPRHAHRGGHLRQRVTVSRQRITVRHLVLCLALLTAAAAGLGVMPAIASSGSSLAGLPVPPSQLPAIRSAALSCPELTPARLAAQVMEASRFDPHATTPDGGSGVAGLTTAQWQMWIPAPGVARGNVPANILALAHNDCNLVGQLRAAGVTGDQWRLALAAFHSGVLAVIAGHAIPASAARYVDTVAAYAAWYAQTKQFGVPGRPAVAPASHNPSASPAASATPKQSTMPQAAPPPSPTAAPSSSPTAAAGSAKTAGNPITWHLTWSDNFNGSAGSPPDPGKWSYDTGGSGWGNQELEYYTTSTANAALNGQGQLVITARQGAPAGASCWYGPCRYSSARLTTLGHFSQEYGRISARIKLPSGQGIWPSFWALGDNFSSAGWPQSGQLNILSHLGSEPATVSGGLIGPNYNAWSSYSLKSGTFASGYHTFTMDWYPDHVSFLVDGHLYDTQYRVYAGASWVFDHPFFLILNLAVGGTESGSPNASTSFPQHMLIDWVRVYEPALPQAAATGPITGLASKCVEAGNGGAVRIDQCAGSAAQTWTVGTDGTIRDQGHCLSVTASANGTRAQLAPCNGSAGQQWRAQTNGQLVNLMSQRCLDATNFSGANLTPLQIWECGGTPNQQWTLP